MPNTLSKVGLTLAATVAVYASILGALTTPPLQRFALYAHHFNTVFYHNINSAEQFGFCKNQVTPFNIQTPDGETLYAWHILPIDVYARNEQSLRLKARPDAPLNDSKATTAFDLLTEDSEARVVISFHGNAGHVAQGWRKDTFRMLTLQPRTHVFTIDYRGFGHSTGSPTEAGLITDGVALVNWVLHTARIPPERIVLLGQSLGTAVVSAVGLEFVDPKNQLHPDRLGGAEDAPLLANGDLIARSTAFAGTILVAPFSNLPSLILTYRMGGLVPLLAPLRPFPALARMLTDNMVDKWPTSDRLRAYYDAFAARPELLTVAGGRKMGSVQIVHGFNDMDITYHQTEMICRRMLEDGEECIDGSGREAVLQVHKNVRPDLRFEIFGHGGHNRIVTYSPVSAAVVRAFEGIV